MNTTATSPYPAQTITEAMDSYFCPVQDSRSPNTAKAYGQALQAFGQVLVEHKLI